MADEPEDTGAEEDAEEASAKKGGSPVPYLVVGMLGVGLGLSVPFLLPGKADDQPTKPDPTPQEEYMVEPDETKSAYIAFSEKSIVVNINDERMSRYLAINFSLKVAEEEKDSMTELLEEKHTPLRSWLITHLARYNLEELRGGAGQNRVKREIRDHFNSFLFPDSGDKIFGVALLEFAIQ